ncbi:MAG TPA: DUF167 domain-containing protein [candidate division CPR3 bacterium]|uniref:DUF167 domain-containing protein n=1 Tax=candidate division CPR3 bacterium TaxID=2268181 RepID=A0A7C1NLN8_UNCC3|nr:DUF167 domain-containing protein [candidate division CPR3 bacterium]
MLIKVKVSSDSSKDEIIKESEDSFIISVKAKPIRGMANMAVQEIIASYFNIPEVNVKLVKGFKDINKVYSVNL